MSADLKLLEAVADELAIVLEKHEPWDLPGPRKRLKSCREWILDELSKRRSGKRKKRK